jgi:5-(carboxyamino)imidazole ribonucleotide synthase
MLNIIGEMPELGEPGSYERTFLHNYGKTARPGRKLGHVTVLGDDEKSREKALKQLAPAFPATANCNSR